MRKDGEEGPPVPPLPPEAYSESDIGPHAGQEGLFV